MSAPLFLLALQASVPGAPAPGYALEALAYPGAATVATLSSGETVAWDGKQVSLHGEDGALLQVLAAVPALTFPSFVAIDPSETFAIVGESSFGDLLKVDLAGGGAQWIARVVFNFDAEFEDSSSLIVSAAQGGFHAGNDLVRVHVPTGTVEALAHVAGPSGPIALDPFGNLFYATQADAFPAPPGSTDVLLFAAAALAGGGVLDEGDALVVAQGFDGGTSLAYDPERGVLYLAEASLVTGETRVVHVNGSPAASPVVVEGLPGTWISGLEVDTAPGGAQLAPYQPLHGGVLRYVATDFAGYAARAAAVPRRPGLDLSGPGLLGPGPFEIAVSAAPPGGLALLAFAPQAAVLPAEIAVATGGPPAFLGLDPAALSVVPVALALDAAGQASFHATNPGGLEGALALQALGILPGGFPAGTSVAVAN